jgi:glycine cleavage system pyridoxal-binding protein P
VNQLAFVAAAYAVVLGGTGGLVALAAAAMRGAERTADELSRRR